MSKPHRDICHRCRPPVLLSETRAVARNLRWWLRPALTSPPSRTIGSCAVSLYISHPSLGCKVGPEIIELRLDQISNNRLVSLILHLL